MKRILILLSLGSLLLCGCKKEGVVYQKSLGENVEELSEAIVDLVQMNTTNITMLIKLNKAQNAVMKKHLVTFHGMKEPNDVDE